MISRRTLIEAMGASMLPFPSFQAGSGDVAPKICLGIGDTGFTLAPGTIDEAAMRRVKQLGVDYVVAGGPRIPWDEAGVKSRYANPFTKMASAARLCMSSLSDWR